MEEPCAKLQLGKMLLLVGGRRWAWAALSFLTAVSCSLTEAVRTRPGGPGDDFVFGTGGLDAAIFAPDGATGGDAAPDAHADGSRGGTTGDGGGTGGRTGSGGAGGVVLFDAGPDVPRACPVDITFACHDYCNALSLAPGCRNKLRASAGLGPEFDSGVIPFDGATPVEPSAAEIVERCKCDCETRYRTAACRSSFDQFVMCGQAPLTTVCTADPSGPDAMPSVIGSGCGALRAILVDCLSAP